MPESRGYPPIADHGAIGNLRTAVLVARDATIDWCCLPDLDSPSVFASILDHRRGGHFRIELAGARAGEQRYLPDTNVLETTLHGDDGTLRVTDFMPLTGPITGRDVASAPPELHRILRCERGRLDVVVEWAPRLDYARGRTHITRSDGAWLAAQHELRVALTGLEDAERIENEHGALVRGRVALAPGEERVLVTSWRAGATAAVARSHALLAETTGAWRDWIEHGHLDEAQSFADPWHEAVVRSGLVLKLLTNPHSGAIAAAATTSLPEEIGGARNWDYRFTWVRDAALTAQALVSLGHRAEALDFLYFLERVSQSTVEAGGRLQIMYGLHGQTQLTETTLEHLEGYRGSRPVRIGNAAADQRQLDVFGELLGAAYEFLRHGGTMPADLWAFLALLVERAAEVWSAPDHGIWEVRGEPRHFVHSKLMIWVALDRGIRIAEKLGLPAPLERWKASRAAVRAAILEQGIDRDRGVFVQSFGSDALDAANLLIPIVGFLPFDDVRVQQTLDATLRELTHNGLVYRYLNDDGLPGAEGAFGLTTFWAADALTLSGRLDEAEALVHGIAGRANHLGLFAEQFDPHTGAQLGNFPQAFSHIGLINSALYLARARGRAPALPAPMGTRAHRAETGHEPGAAA